MTPLSLTKFKNAGQCIGIEAIGNIRPLNAPGMCRKGQNMLSDIPEKNQDEAKTTMLSSKKVWSGKRGTEALCPPP